MFQSVTHKFHNRIKNACAPLFDSFNVRYFWFSKINNSGYHALLGSNPAWAEYFCSEKLYLKYPYLRHPTCLEAGVNIHTGEQEKPFQDICQSAVEKFGLQQTLQILVKVPDGIEEYGFSSPSVGGKQTAIFINELPLFHLFVKKFRGENGQLFSHLEDNLIDASNLLGPTFYPKVGRVSDRFASKQAFLKKMGIEIGECLSPREIGVVRLLLQGYSAGKIASQVHLSKRTVEHHLERMKEKLGCYSKAELIQKARELEQYGGLVNI